MDEMATKHKNIYLWLGLICFLGIILIFVFDGFMGVYDSLLMNNLQYQETVTADQWAQREKFGSISINVEQAGKIEFTYTIENHWFSKYTSLVDVSMWYSDTKLKEIKTENVQIQPFGKGEVKWTLDAASLLPDNYPSNQNYNISLIISDGDIQRKVQIFIYPSVLGEKLIPSP
jgi:hypothetical protein